MNAMTIGYALCGSFCTFSKSLPQMQILAEQGFNILPIMSENAYKTDTRFGAAQSFIDKIENIAQREVIHTISQAEPIGPKKMCDLLIVAPCTGNTLSKMCNAITDTSVTMAVKSHLRIGRPVLLAIATNDGLGASAQNIGKMLNTKNVFLTPFSQDDPINKPNSIVSHFDLIPQCAALALTYKQMQPIFRQLSA